MDVKIKKEQRKFKRLKEEFVVQLSLLKESKEKSVKTKIRVSAIDISKHGLSIKIKNKATQNKKFNKIVACSYFLLFSIFSLNNGALFYKCY